MCWFFIFSCLSLVYGFVIPQNTTHILSSDNPLADNIDNFYQSYITVEVLGGVIIGAGLFFTFFGHRFFPVSVSLASAVLAAFFTFNLLPEIEALTSKANPSGDKVWPDREKVYSSILISVAVLAAALSYFFYKAGKYILGALGGVMVFLNVQAFIPSDILANHFARWGILAACGILGVVLVVMVIERTAIIIITSTVGSVLFIAGVDCFAHFGLLKSLETLQQDPTKEVFYSLNQNELILLGCGLIMNICGLAVQFFKTSKLMD